MQLTRIMRLADDLYAYSITMVWRRTPYVLDEYLAKSERFFLY